MRRVEGVCSCPEGLLTLDDGSMVRVPGHDCQYVADRNRCIAEAERRASAEVSTTYRGAWSAAFLRHMEDVAREREVIA